jgi:SET domain-containing protein
VIEHLRTGVFCRVKPSPLHGVGLFAIRDIPKGTQMFFMGRKLARRIPRAELADLPQGVMELLNDYFCRFPNGDLDCVAMNLDRPSLCFFINNSEQPNCEYLTDDKDDWTETTRDIKAGEEILRDYRDDGGE